MAGELVSHGGRPVVAAEPDLRVTLWFQWYGVAAKRVRSRSKILGRVKLAANQVDVTSDRGIVAVSLDNYADRRRRGAPGVGAGDRFFAAFPEVEEAERWLAEHAPKVKAMFSFGFLASWRIVDARPRLDTTSATRITLLNLSEDEEQCIYGVLKEHRGTYEKRWLAATTR